MIAAAGDIACDAGATTAAQRRGISHACRQEATAALLQAGRYAAILALGDIQYETGDVDEFRASYHASWGRQKRITYPAPGNHEYSTPGARGYFAYFGSRAGDPARGYYSFDVGSWHLIALNSNCGAVGGCGTSSPQGRWLRADLAAHRNACTLAYWHHPRFSSGLHGNNTTYDGFWRLLYAAGADLVLVGHDHDYERFGPQDPSGRADRPRGIRQFVVGTGGRSHYPLPKLAPNTQVRNGSTFGVLALTLHPDRYDWRFKPISGERFSDSGSDRCH